MYWLSPQIQKALATREKEHTSLARAQGQMLARYKAEVWSWAWDKPPGNRLRKHSWDQSWQVGAFKFFQRSSDI